MNERITAADVGAAQDALGAALLAPLLAFDHEETVRLAMAALRSMPNGPERQALKRQMYFHLYSAPSAPMAKLVDARDSKSLAERCADRLPFGESSCLETTSCVDSSVPGSVAHPETLT